MEQILKEDTFFDKISFGIIKSLEKRQGIVDLKLYKKSPVESHNIKNWEQKYSCLMPSDLKNFYLTNDGFLLTWSVKMNETRVPVGRMEINALDVLTRLGGTSGTSGDGVPSVCDVDLDHSMDEGSVRPRFDHRSRIFELDPCDGNGKVCLVYNNTKPGIPAQNADIWFMDRALEWHFLADSFLTYYRLMITHFGLPLWQYSLTDIGLTPQAKQWFHMYAPLRLDVVLKENDSQMSLPTVNALDVGKVFRGRSDKKRTTQQLQNQRKKPSTATSKNQLGGSRGTISNPTKSTK